MDTRILRLRFLSISPALLKWSAAIVVVGLIGLTLALTRNLWLPPAANLWAALTEPEQDANKTGKKDPHAGHEHGGHAGHEEGTSLQLSPQAKKNVGLETMVVKLDTYIRTVSLPAIVVGRPGRAQIELTAPLGGRVTRIYPIEGEAVEPGQPLFDLRLTHEELVQAQGELLQSVEQLDVELREIERLQAIVESGTIPGKRVLEREYEKQKIEAAINAQRQSLLLHGLTQEQIDQIIQTRMLVQDITVYAPEHFKNGKTEAEHQPFTVRSLKVKPGEYVDAGVALCQLIAYDELYIQGRAFEQDDRQLQKAAREGWDISATREENSDKPELIENLKIVYVENEVDPQTRALHFYVRLPNEVVHESKSPDGHRFLTWRYKPGQRMQLSVPVENWPDRIVLPVDAVAKDGVEYYVFQQNGDHFDRVPVHVEYQDRTCAILANDGSVFPGDTIAKCSAQQLQMALKNKAGGGVDPHAGHSH